MKGLVKTAVGFAADDRGYGVAYARLRLGQSPRVLRVPFTVTRYPALLEREVGYAALAVVSAALQQRGIDSVRFSVEDERLASDLRERRDVPAPLTLSYIRLRCVLNGFKEFDIVDEPGDLRDLTARARSEVALHVAA
jgi:hypothetical protein